VNKPSYKELLAQSEALLAQAMEAKAIEARAAIETCTALIAEFELTPFDLGFVKTQIVPAAKAKKDDKTFAVKKPKRAYPPKYVNPATGATWSGMGHTPKWIVGNRDDYLIKNKRTTQNNKTA
jgi:DNA-binding protein H-NS